MNKTLLAVAALIALAAAPARAQLAGKKVLFVNSYHEGYEWSDGVERGASQVLKATGATVVFHRMDTKRHQEEEYRKKAALEAKAAIEAAKPDAVILADDPAVKYVLVPYFKDASIPFVFAGVNWDATKYGLPFKNATGMVEVALVKELLGAMKDYAKGPRVGFLTVDSETERIELPFYKKALGISFASEKLVKSLAEWKAAFAAMQGEVDMILLGNFAGINDWDEKDAAAFAAANSKVISGGMYDFMMPYVMIGYAKVAEEQGAFAAKTVIEVLGGKPASAIPVAANKQAKILINPALGAKAGIVFKPELVRTAAVAMAR
jgi:ABC-type uncharacterized transport system substrate-binding protein